MDSQIFNLQPCSTCLCKFASLQDQRAHYRSQYHDFNLKRKIVGLKPLQVELYEKYINQIQSQQKDQENQQKQFKCQCCLKSFKSNETYQNHLQSKKHLEVMQNEELKNRTFKQKEFLSIKETALYSINICLFCNHKSQSFEENLNHMQTLHSFFICEEKNCVDKENLIRKLADQIFNQLECIHCCYLKTKGFKHFQDVQKHMLTQSHCKMNQFYTNDFKDVYNYEDENKIIWEKFIQNNPNKFLLKDFERISRKKSIEKNQAQSESCQSENSDWESMNEIEEGEQPKDIPNDYKQYRDLRNFVWVNSYFDSTHSLVLPNDKVIGHKINRHIFKQKYNEINTEQKMISYLEKQQDENIQQQLQLVSQDEEKLRDLYKLVKKQNHIREFKNYLKIKSQQDKVIAKDLLSIRMDKINMQFRNNRVLTKHFRCQIMQ